MCEFVKKKLVLELKGVTKKYKDLTVLNSVDFRMFEGDSVAISGSSGSGKTTLLQICGLIDNCHTGELRIFDNIIDFRKKKSQNTDNHNKDKYKNTKSSRKKYVPNLDSTISQIRQQMGFVFQSHYLLPEFTVLENTLMSQRMTGNVDVNFALELLHKMNLLDKKDSKIAQLSGGQCQRVAIARALSHKPKIIFADEPTGNLDPINSKKVLKLLINCIKEFNSSLVMVTHDERHAKLLNNIIHIEKGKLSIQATHEVSAP